MDDNTKRLVEEYLDTERELAEFRAMKRQLINLLWKAELAEAVDAKKYSWKYGEKLEDTKVKTCDVREIFGIMPSPKAVTIYKEHAEEQEDNANE